MTILSAALLLFLILDPLGNVPVFLSVLKSLTPARQRVVLVRELLIALGVLMLFLWCGKYALELMHLRQESVAIAGGAVLFLIGIRMIFPRPEGLMGGMPDGEPFIVPLAIPLVAGPSGMAAVMLMGSNEPDRLGEWSLALLLAWGVTAAILLASPVLYRLLGPRPLAAIERLMGMLLVAISVQMLLDGLTAYLGIATAAA
ncbi:YhgN family NAAT transporter [Pseudoxanthomonas koreensis]|uniref:YhgN family NAAT transporter n=1 Tax=Pseudoxanthomonas koreensis TaxID=266061 RepID=UPI0035A5DED8